MRLSLSLRERVSIAVAACALLVAGNAAAVYPDRPIKVFLPFPPGGAVDFVSRLVCAEATEILGKPVVSDHRPGAGGTVATDATARSQPDGYSIMITTPSHTINPALRPKLPFDTATDFAPVSLIASVPELLVAHPSVPFDTLDGLRKYEGESASSTTRQPSAPCRTSPWNCSCAAPLCGSHVA
jgi:tripartite-type tricarboxylate transporter receptor subunit TctC